MLPLFAAGTLTASVIAAMSPSSAPAAVAVPLAATHKIYGFVQSVRGNTLVIQNRSGRTIVVDTRAAYASVRVYRGRPIIVFGTTNPNGVVHATAVWRTYPDSVHWPADH